MSKSSPIQTSFNGGELGPLVEGRVDSEKHATGLEHCLNYLPTIEGPIVRRPGTKRVASVKDPSKPPRFIPFKISNNEQYIIEAGENYFRFFTDEGQLVTNGTSYVITSGVFNFAGETSLGGAVEGPFTGSRSTQTLKELEVIPATNVGVTFSKVNFSSVVSGSILEIPTIYDYNMVQGIGFRSKADTLWIMHSSIPTFTLQRFGSQDWDLKYFPTKDGPYLPLNSYKNSGDNLRTQLRVINQVQDSTDIYSVRTHSSILVNNVISNSGTNKIEIWTHVQHQKKNGDKIWINGVVGATCANNGSSFSTAFSSDGPPYQTPTGRDSSVWIVQVITSTSLLLLDSTFSGSYTGSGVIYPALFSQQDQGRNIGLYINGHRHFGYITMGSSLLTDFLNLFINPIQAKVAIDFESKIVVSASAVTTAWQLGAHNDYHGFPSAGTFHQNRLVFNSTPGRPTEFTASKINEFQYFSVSEASSLIVSSVSALQFNLISESNDFLEWVESGAHGLYFASNSTEFNVSPSREGEALTPTNINCEIVGNFGTSDLNPVRFGDSIIYVQNSKRKIRELRYFENLQAHKSTQINQLSDHIAYPSAAGFAVQKEPYPSIWGYKTDGGLISLTYAREDSQAVYGWAQHQLGGRSDSADSVPKIKALEVIRDSTGKYDQIWMAVQRFINGTSTVEVEYMVEPYRHRDQTQKQRDAFYVDCGATYDSSLVITNITRGSALITCASHGLQRNDLVLITDVIGMNSSLLDINQVLVNSNLVNDKVFVVGSTTANTFFLQDFNSSIIVSATYSPYVSSGKARKLVSTVGGLTWLKNEEVDILGDGGYQGKQTVNSAGVLTLTNPAAVVQIGYAYKSRGTSLVKDSGSRTGSAMGMFRKTFKAAFRLKDVGDFRYSGLGFDSMHETDFGIGNLNQSNYAIPLFTGIFVDGPEGDISYYSQVYFEQKTPLPGMIQSITYMMDEYDV